jgi:hypothetical protein
MVKRYTANAEKLLGTEIVTSPHYRIRRRPTATFSCFAINSFAAISIIMQWHGGTVERAWKAPARRAL